MAPRGCEIAAAPRTVNAACKSRDMDGIASLKMKGSAMAVGIVKWFNPTKGYGFIEPVDGSEDVFVHMSAVAKAGLSLLKEGQRVSYDVAPGRDGKNAADNLVLND